MKLRTLIVPVAVALAAASPLAGCARRSAHAQTAAQPAVLRVALSAVDRTPMQAELTLPGLVSPRTTYELSFPLGGVVRAVYVVEGQRVRRGAALARLDATTARASSTQAREGLARAERDLRRAQALSAQGSLPAATFEDAETGAAVARAGLSAAGFAMRHTVLRAPSDGVVDLRFVDADEVVGPGTPVLRLVDAREGWALRVAVPDRYVNALRVGDVASVRLDAGDVEVAARVAEVARVPTAGMGTFDVELALTPPPGTELRMGLVGRATLALGERYGASVPTSAVVDGRGNDAYVFAVRDGAARRLRVGVAFVRGDRAVIASGLDGVEAVVSAGAERLDDRARVDVAGGAVDARREARR